MTSTAVLAIDQGTTNTKVLLVGADGAVLARASRAVTLRHPRPDWTEQDADAIWSSVVDAIAEVTANAPEAAIAAVAIANQRETVVVWDALSGRPIAPAATWQCRRSTERCAALRAEGREQEVIARTGLGLDPLFPSGKIGMILDAMPGARARAEAGELRAGTIDSWLLWRLTGGAVHATDISNASRTQLFSLDDLAWDDALLDMFAVPRAMMPEVRSSDALFGHVAPGVTALPGGTAIHAVLGDSHAALFGHGLNGTGRAKVTIGTGSSLMALTGVRARSISGLSGTIAWSRGGTVCHALEGNVAVSGHAAAFACELLAIPDEAALTALAASVEDSAGVTFVPALAGLGAPHWRDRARGALGGLSLGTRREHVARAVLEGIALQIGDVVEAVESDLGVPIAALSVDGGAAANNLLMQLLADVVDRPILRPTTVEVGALGVARLAADAVGVADGGWRDASTDRFAPSMAPEPRRALRNRWRIAVAAVSLDRA